jgi:L-ascorbate metabolism protein UlaG (beta-lactamase superfamily)
MTRALFLSVALLLIGSAHAHEHQQARVRHVANAGAMVESGDTRVLFDPLYTNTFDRYDAVPDEIRAHVLAGVAPWDGVDAVFVSHYHEDHFDPEALLELLMRQPGVHLYGPEQAAQAVRKLIGDATAGAHSRIHGIGLELGDPAQRIEFGTLSIDALRLPHAGWPERHQDVENIVFRVTLDDTVTAMHLGDADTVDDHFAMRPDFWSERRTDLALPPYWFFLNAAGREILDTRIAARQTIGVHVPAEVPDEPDKRPAALQRFDIFTRPGETRQIGIEAQ